MPIYNYQCTNCEAIITLMHSFDEKHVDCPECMSENSLVKLLNRPFIEKNNTDIIAIRSMMMLSLGFDHRLIDGAGGASFIAKIKNNLENMNLEDLF